MFGNKKESLYLGQFLRLFLQKIVKGEAEIRLPKDVSFTKKELEKIKQELFYFRIIILGYQLIDHRRFGGTKFNNEEIGKTLGIAFSLALQDTGSSKPDAEKQSESLIERIGIYEDYLGNLSQKELKEHGIYFNLIQCFEKIVLGDNSKRLLTNEGRDKAFTVFDYGKQTYRNLEEAFKGLIKTIKFLD